MNLLERVIETRNQVEQVEHDFLAGTIESSEMRTRIQLLALKMKGEEIIYKVTDRKKGRSLPTGLVGDMNPENSMIACPDQDGKFITRRMCLSFSGDSKNNGTCSSCKQFGKTRKLLLPEV